MAAAAGRRLAALALALCLTAALAQPPLSAQDPEALYRAAVDLLDGAQEQAAEAVFLKTLEQAPQHFRARMALARLYLKKSPARALEQLDEARIVAPAADGVHYLRGQALEALGRPLEAAEAYREAIRLNARHYDANTRLRAVLRALRAKQTRTEQASERFWAEPSLRTLALFGRILLEEAPPSQALLELEQIREQRPELPEAELWIARVQHRMGSAAGEIEAYRRYLARRGAAPGVRLILAERLLEAGRLAETRAVLEPLGPSAAQADLDTSDRARLAYLQGRAAGVLSAPAPAVAAAAGSLAAPRVPVAPGLPLPTMRPAQATALLAEAARLGYDPARVAAALEEEVAQNPEQAAVWWAYADGMQAAGRTEAAVAGRLQAARLDPVRREAARQALTALRAATDNPEAVWVGMAELALADDRPTDALAWLRRIPPGHPAFARSTLLLGLLYRRVGDAPMAADMLRRYQALFPGPDGALYARGMVLWESGQRPQAAALWQHSPQALAKHPDVLVPLVALLQARGDAAGEREFRAQLARAQPRNAANSVRLGDLFLAAGRHAEALGAWQRALAEQPNDFEVLVRVGRLQLSTDNSAAGRDALLRAWRLSRLPDDLAAPLARLLAAQRREEEALALYWQVYQAHPDDPAARAALPRLALNVPADAAVRMTAARIAEQTGRTALAADLARAVLVEAPDNGEARAALDRLAPHPAAR
jgi:tetratricopeptide (TPR) repeat protein